MSIGALGSFPHIEKPAKGLSRREVVEQVFNRYHKNLINWCIYKLKTKNLGFDHQSDAEEIVAEVYATLLDEKKSPIDLNNPNIEAYLNTALQHAIGHYIREKNTKKRRPEGLLLSLEEVEDRKDIAPQLTQYFAEHTSQHTSDKEEMYEKIEQALKRLGSRNPKMAKIIKERYGLGKTQVQIAESYGEKKQNIQNLEKQALGFLYGIITGRIMSDLSIPKGKIKKQG